MREDARFCGKCGTKLSQSAEPQIEGADPSQGLSRTAPSLSPAPKPPSAEVLKKRGIVIGAVLILCGLSIYLWAQRHSPHMGLGEAMMAMYGDLNAYYIKEPVYSLIVLFAAALVLWGAICLVRGLGDQRKR